MSVYSGFATRQLEQQYSSLLQLLILTLSKRLVKLYREEDCNEKAFRGVLYRIVSGLKILESTKYVPPKFSENVKILYETLQSQDQNEFKPNKQMQNTNGFEMLHKQTDFVITPEKQELPLNEQKKFTGMPPHPLKSLRANQISSEFQSQHETSIDRKSNNLLQNSALKTSTFTVDNSNDKAQQKDQATSTVPEQPNFKLDQKEEVKAVYQDNPLSNNQTFADLVSNDQNIALPQLDQQQQAFYIPSNVIDQIQKQVEVSILQKYSQPPGMITKVKRKNKSKIRKRGQQATFRQLLLEFDQEDQILNKTFHQAPQMDQNPNNYDPQFKQANSYLTNKKSHGRYKLMPLSEGNRTRPKFYSSGK